MHLQCKIRHGYQYHHFPDPHPVFAFSPTFLSRWQSFLSFQDDGTNVVRRATPWTQDTTTRTPLLVRLYRFLFKPLDHILCKPLFCLCTRKRQCQVWQPEFHRRTTAISAVFFCPYVSVYGRDLRGIFGCAGTYEPVCQPASSCPPLWQGVASEW